MRVYVIPAGRGREAAVEASRAYDDLVRDGHQVTLPCHYVPPEPSSLKLREEARHLIRQHDAAYRLPGMSAAAADDCAEAIKHEVPIVFSLDELNNIQCTAVQGPQPDHQK